MTTEIDENLRRLTKEVFDEEQKKLQPNVGIQAVANAARVFNAQAVANALEEADHINQRLATRLAGATAPLEDPEAFAKWLRLAGSQWRAPDDRVWTFEAKVYGVWTDGLRTPIRNALRLRAISRRSDRSYSDSHDVYWPDVQPEDWVPVDVRPIIHPAFLELNCQRANRWHDGSIHNWGLLDWATAFAGEVGEAIDVVLAMDHAERDGVSVADVLDRQLLQIFAAMGEAANTKKKLNRIRDDIANVSDNPDRHVADVQQAHEHIASALEFVAAEAAVLATQYGNGGAPVIGWGSAEGTPEELGAELFDVVAYLTLLAQRGLADVNKAGAEKFNATSERYGFEERWT